ncbi:type II toxin-antitoxin system VapC family toxin [Actinomycetospora sp. TBRC 11914]|uniref:type II toxin-antitoxin system VapC family toxin n=1 Tax=Actinomycetospora sp. TBRC 11914 TaxID=2729387 RepID=UPI00145EC735|nr:type II toxin-antitoxin system VapC family toxin [Actinomycetospora sp. TBRC 11914]NMO90407.1 type II toxin-antitoxin system VapC family toxin [Actinomycetospora sp. TBRC 11914]
MIACDVNVLVHAFNADDAAHEPYRAWLERAAAGPEPFGLASVVASGFVRVVTHPKVLAEPLAVVDALERLADLRAAPAVVPMEPGDRHWALFDDLCRRTGARGNAVPDAYLAALAIEHGCTWMSADRGFARYPGLRFRHPLDP